MESVQSLTDEVTLLRKENVALTKENIVSRILNSHHSCFDTCTALGNDPTVIIGKLL